MIQAAKQITRPKTTMCQNCMQAVEDAIQDNIVGLTDDLANRHLKYVVDDLTDMTIVTYKGKERIRFGFRGQSQEFFIEHRGAVSA